MGSQYGVAGKSTKDTANRKFNSDLKFRIFIAIMAIVIVVMLFNYKALRLGWVGVLGLIVILYLLPDILKRATRGRKKEQRQYYRGAVGEEQVGQLLSQLSSNFVVMNDVVSPYGNIDHIVYDNRGNIFLIETKSHGGYGSRVIAQGDQLLLNGHTFEKDIVGQCLANSYWMRDKFETEFKVKAWITPVLVFTNAFVEFGKPIKGVYYTNKKYLLQFLQRTNASSAAGLKLWEKRKVNQAL
jgi:hypothetical protein